MKKTHSISAIFVTIFSFILLIFSTADFSYIIYKRNFCTTEKTDFSYQILYPCVFFIAKVILITATFIIYFTIRNQKNNYKLKDSKLELQTIIENIPGGVCCFSKDNAYSITYISSNFLELTGYSRIDITESFNNNFLMLIFNDDQPKFLSEIQNINAKISDSQFRIMKKDGSVIWVLCKCQLIELNNKSGIFYSVIMDITDIKLTEITLLKSQKKLTDAKERYRIVAAQSDSIVYEYDIIKNCIVNNERFDDMFNYSFFKNIFPDDAISEKIVHPDDAQRFTAFYQSIREGTKYLEDEHRLYTKNCVYEWFNVKVTTIFDENNKPVRAIGNLKNISAKKTTKLRDLTYDDIDPQTELLVYNTAKEFIKYIISYNRTDFHSLIIIKIHDYSIKAAESNDLVAFCKKIKNLFRSSDVVSVISDDSFMIFLKSCTKNLVLHKVNDVNIILTKNNLNASFGISYYPDDSVTFELLYKNAIDKLDAIIMDHNSYNLYKQKQGII